MNKVYNYTTMYDRFISGLKTKKDINLNRLDLLLKSKAYYEGKILKDKVYLNRISNISVRMLFTKDKLPYNLKLIGDKDKVEYLRLYIHNYYKTVKLIKTVEVTLVKLNESFLSKKEFRTVLFTMNREAMKLAIIENVPITFGRAGLIVIKYIDRESSNKSKVLPDWKESNKNKANIIAKGGIPFKSIKDDKGKVIGDNGGEKWLATHISKSTFYIDWMCNYVINNKIYRFTPSKYNDDRNVPIDANDTDKLFDLKLGFVPTMHRYHKINPIGYYKFT